MSWPCARAPSGICPSMSSREHASFQTVCRIADMSQSADASWERLRLGRKALQGTVSWGGTAKVATRSTLRAAGLAASRDWLPALLTLFLSRREPVVSFCLVSPSSTSDLGEIEARRATRRASTHEMVGFKPLPLERHGPPGSRGRHPP